MGTALEQRTAARRATWPALVSRATRWRSLTSPRARRALLGLLLAGVVVFPSQTSSDASRPCLLARCDSDGRVLWSARLPGAWLAEPYAGTVPAQGQAYVGIGGGVAVVGAGQWVQAFDEKSGRALWDTVLSGFSAGSAVVSVRSWGTVVTVGVQTEPASGSAAAPGRTEVVLNAQTGKTLREYPAAQFGGAVAAGRWRTVVVGRTAVTDYRNATGRASWRVPTGAPGQAWQVQAGQLYITVSAAGAASTAPVTAVRAIRLRTGAQRLIHPARGAFAGTFGGVADGVLLFSGAGGLTAYSTRNGQRLWARAGAVAEMTDPVRHVLYLSIGGHLVGVDARTGLNLRGDSVPGQSGAYDIRGGVALGLDPGSSGTAWGYSISARQVIWTTRALPWPHYFVDLSGIGGSADAGSDTVLLATCASTGTQVVGGSALACLRPELVAITR